VGSSSSNGDDDECMINGGSGYDSGGRRRRDWTTVHELGLVGVGECRIESNRLWYIYGGVADFVRMMVMLSLHHTPLHSTLLNSIPKTNRNWKRISVVVSSITVYRIGDDNKR